MSETSDPIHRLERDYAVDRGQDILMNAAERHYLEAKTKFLDTLGSMLNASLFFAVMFGIAWTAWFLASR